MSRVRLSGWANIAEVLGVILALMAIWQVEEDQNTARHYQAWQTILAAQGKPGSGGRIHALEDLNGAGVEMNGVNLTGDSVAGAYLINIEIPKAKMDGADLEGANLLRANLNRAHLNNANLKGARLEGANLEGARLWKAHLMGARLDVANLRAAYLVGANLQGAYLRGADLEQADLSGTNLKGARLGTEYRLLAGEPVAPRAVADYDNFGILDLGNDVFFILSYEEADSTLERGAVDNRGPGARTVDSTATKQVLSSRDWRGAMLPDNLKHLELPYDAPDSELDRLRVAYRYDH